MNPTTEWTNLTENEKHRQLYYKQKQLLDTFLEHQTITQEQYNKSLGDLTVKWGCRRINISDWSIWVTV